MTTTWFDMCTTIDTIVKRLETCDIMHAIVLSPEVFYCSPAEYHYIVSDPLIPLSPLSIRTGTVPNSRVNARVLFRSVPV